MNYTIEARVSHRRGRNAGFNTRVVRYVVIPVGFNRLRLPLLDARGNARKFETPEAAEAAAKAWVAAQQVSA